MACRRLDGSDSACSSSKVFRSFGKSCVEAERCRQPGVSRVCVCELSLCVCLEAEEAGIHRRSESGCEASGQTLSLTGYFGATAARK